MGWYGQISNIQIEKGHVNCSSLHEGLQNFYSFAIGALKNILAGVKYHPPPCPCSRYYEGFDRKTIKKIRTASSKIYCIIRNEQDVMTKFGKKM